MVAAVDPVSITATSLGPGTTPPLQFEPTSKLPLPAIQLIVAGSVRSSNDSSRSAQGTCLGRWAVRSRSRAHQSLSVTGQVLSVRGSQLRRAVRLKPLLLSPDR